MRCLSYLSVLKTHGYDNGYFLQMYKTFTLLTVSEIFQSAFNYFTLNVFHVKPIDIGIY